jgi:hypothetical protein
LSDSSIRAALAFSHRCTGEPVPGMGSIAGDRWSSQLTAIWAGIAP